MSETDPIGFCNKCGYFGKCEAIGGVLSHYRRDGTKCNYSAGPVNDSAKDAEITRLHAEAAELRAEVDRLNHEEAEWFTAHARGFRDADKGIFLTDCKEDTRNAATAWACGWLERAWQLRCEKAERERDAALAEVGRVTKDRDALAERVRVLEGRIENLLNSMEAVRLNDRSEPYEYGESRRLDEAAPGAGQRWSTPFEISRDAIRAYAESVFGQPGVQSKKQLDALTPPAQQQKHKGDSQ